MFDFLKKKDDKNKLQDKIHTQHNMTVQTEDIKTTAPLSS